MSNIRIHKLAKELGISSKSLLSEIRKQGVDAKNHMSSVDESTAEIIKELFKTDPETESSPVPAQPNEKGKEDKEGAHLKDLKMEKAGAKGLNKPSPDARKHAVSELNNKIKLPELLTVKELAEKIGKNAAEVIKKMMKMGTIATVNQTIQGEFAVRVGKEFGLDPEVISIFSDDIIEDVPEDKGKLVQRPPVVTIMGHVDHGKTSLLDVIRKTKVTDKEAGGITQHIGAYSVHITKGDITFLDTPGHEAFTAMRARGAKVTDIIVLIVAADDGVMPQTVEAIHHAEAAKVPVIVAINKIDLPGANPEAIKQKLTEYNLVPEEWGGETIFVEVSAKNRIGIDHLLEMILLQAEIMELKADPDANARGVLIEAKLTKGRGPVGTVLVQKGTLVKGQPFVVGIHNGKIRAIIDDKGEQIEKAGPSQPVEILGFSDVPNAGDSFIVVDEERKARQISSLRLNKQRIKDLSSSSRITLDDLYSQINKGEVKELKVVLKGDVQGSVQALTEALEKLSAKEVCIKIIHGATGGITDTDIMLAAASNAIIVGFNVRPSEKTSELAKSEQVDVRLYTVVYKAISDIKSAMEGMLCPVVSEKILGRAEVREIFTIPKLGTIAGCYVVSGKIQKSVETRLIRNNVIVYQGKIGSLRRFKEDAKEVSTGYECGIRIEKFQDVKLGDIIEPFVYEEVKKSL